MSDDELGALMTNLGGHDIEMVIDTLRAEADGDQPTCFIAYTIKGMGLPFAGHKDNHAGLMTKEQMEGFRASMGIRPGHEWDLFEGLDVSEEELRGFLGDVPVRHAADAGRPRVERTHGAGAGVAAVGERSLAAGCPRRRASATSSPRSAAARAN